MLLDSCEYCIPTFGFMTNAISDQSNEGARFTWPAFLRDVFVCSLGAYGGPEAHMSVFLDQLVVKRRYLTESDLIELIALCSILPGPTSSQTIVAIGYKHGGPWLAFLTMIVWALPVLVVMTVLSFLYQFLASQNISNAILRYVGPMAVGFILVAAYRIGRKVVRDSFTATLMVTATILTSLIRTPWIFPLVLLIGGAAAIVTALVTARADDAPPSQLWNRVTVRPPWIYLSVFATLALGGALAATLTDNPFVRLAESFYRYGYLVFGGGQVVVPVMHGELVHLRGYMTNQEFLTGYGLVQGLPGPMFSFAAYAGGMAARGGGAWRQIMGAIAGGIGIFLPGLLLIYFVYPVWEQLKGIGAIRVALRGINAVAGGMIAAAAVVLMRAGGFQWDNLAVTAVAVLLLASRKVPAPLIVLAALAVGMV